MPIITPVEVRAGDPTVQASGQHRGTVTGTQSTDARIVERSIRAADLSGWDAKVAAMPAEMQVQMEAQDAAQAVTPDEDVAANNEASVAQTCVAYIREAAATEQAYDAWLLYDRINTYVTNHSDWNSAHDHLIAEGLTQEEYDQAKNAYNYLSGAGRPAIMAEAKTIQAAWESQ
jgi:hypothetical protein